MPGNNQLEKILIMKKTIGAIVVDADRCKGCSLCVVACPKNVIALSARRVNAHGYPFVEAARPADCIGCAACGIVCPDGCITVYRKRIEVDDSDANEQNAK